MNDIGTAHERPPAATPRSPPPAVAMASARTPGYDVARAIAILGMVLVNFRAMAAPDEWGAPWLEWGIDRLEGKAAALFVLLAGVGVSLRVRSAERRGLPLRGERRALMTRAGVLFAVGLLNLHMWEWDILHLYGVYLFAAAWLFPVGSAGLLGLAGVVALVNVPLIFALEYDLEMSVWSLEGIVRDLFFNGLFPAFPWLAFLLVGMVVGRLDLRDRRVRIPLLWTSLVALVGLEVLNADMGARSEAIADGEFTTYDWFCNWPRPPTPAFVLSGAAFAVAVIAGFVELTERWPRARWVVALTATGQLALTVYIAHEVAILVAMAHGWFDAGELGPVVTYALAFYAAAVIGSLWWRARWRHGPLEHLIRQITSASPAAPWGGAALADVDTPTR